MKYGYGSPFVRVYTSVGEVTENIVDFNYKYSQEEDDTCQITIQTKDNNLPDRPEFQENVILKVTWGYIGEDKTINVHISNIRKKLKIVTEEEYIETVWGIGFRLAK